MKFHTSMLLVALLGSVEAFWKRNDQSDFQNGMVTGCRGKEMDLSNEMSAAKCMPRHTLVKLPRITGYEMYPDIVSVKRCSGLCFNNKSCMEVEKKSRGIVVRIRSFIDPSKYICYSTFVEDHVDCKCQCNVKASHCNGFQEYSENDCACKCKNIEQWVICLDTPGMRWDDKTCKCSCNKSQEECSTGLEWVPALCRCAKIMDMSKDEIRNNNEN